MILVRMGVLEREEESMCMCFCMSLIIARYNMCIYIVTVATHGDRCLARETQVIFPCLITD